MIIEVTRDFFKSIISDELKCNEVTEKELYRDIIYIVNGVKMFSRINHASGVIQYYIIDINA